MKAVLDANVFISALINLAGAPFEVLAAWRAGRFVAISSIALRDEVQQVGARPRTARYLRASPAAIATVLAELDLTAVFVLPDRVRVVEDDPADDDVLGTASAGDADYIVSGDKHLLALGSFQGIPIVTPARFLLILAAEPSSPENP
jgi:putative PIN family toxin of toxin-antitoxin system